MVLRRLAHDYYHAIASACGQKGGLLTATWSVVIARLCYDIGPRYHSLFQLGSRSRTQWPEYLIDDSLKPLLKNVNSEPARALVRDKLLFYRHCLEHQLTTIPVIYAFDPRDIDAANTGKDLAGEFSNALDNAGDNIFFKLIDGSWGEGAFSASRIGNGLWQVEGSNFEPLELLAFCKRRHEETDPDSKGWIVQSRIDNHQDIKAALSPVALSTVRIVTIIDQNGIEILLAVARLPTGQNNTDNFAHGSSGNLVAAMDIDSGQIGQAWTSLSGRWPKIVPIDKHPDTGVSISGHRLPDWEDALDLVRCAHRSLPGLKAVGWDIAFTDNGPIIVEANGQFDVDLLQVALNQGLASILLPRLAPGTPTAGEPLQL
ncbi:sugar-transfer associated ATP-grasp domain-containing protein [Parahaliea aestuarii]|nr:sugar-transfer associated ATP-grasp domain-containing protein [Parahaliea aestuarii]